jgi:hypothetical protein
MKPSLNTNMSMPPEQFLVQFRMDQVHLTQVGFGRIARHPRAVFDSRAQMRVALDAERGQEPDGLLVRLAERVRRAAAHRGHEPVERHVLGPLCLGLEIV